MNWVSRRKVNTRRIGTVDNNAKHLDKRLSSASDDRASGVHVISSATLAAKGTSNAFSWRRITKSREETRNVRSPSSLATVMLSLEPSCRLPTPSEWAKRDFESSGALLSWSGEPKRFFLRGYYGVRRFTIVCFVRRLRSTGGKLSSGGTLLQLEGELYP
jgi:hypothetical protein